METTLLYSTIYYIICNHFLNNLEDMIWCDMQNELLKWVLRKYNTRKTLKRYVYFVTIWLKSFLLCWNSYSQMFFYVNETREKFTTRLSATGVRWNFSRAYFKFILVDSRALGASWSCCSNSTDRGAVNKT